MGTTPAITPGAGLDWNVTSLDYLEHRPGYPSNFFDTLQALGVGFSGQRIPEEFDVLREITLHILEPIRTA